jgi:hypothetical protein
VTPRDILGGLVIALGVSAAWIRLFPALAPVGGGWPDRRALQGLWFPSLGLLVLTPLWPPLAPRYVGALIGLAVSYTGVLVTGAPRDGGTTRRRLTRALLALALFAITLGVTERMLAFAGLSGGRLPELFLRAVVTASTFAGTMMLCRRLGLYEA